MFGRMLLYLGMLLQVHETLALDIGEPLLVSKAWTGAPANGICGSPHFARGNSRYLTFACLPPLVPEDTNQHADVYLIDRTTDQIERASVTSDGTEIRFDSVEGFVSDDGRLVAFESLGPMHPDATQPPGHVASNVFLRDRLLGQTHYVSPDVSGQVPFYSVTLRDVYAARSEILIQTRQQLLDPLGDPLLSQQNLYIRNWQTGAIDLISATSDGGLANGTSARSRIVHHHRQVLFASTATNLPDAPTQGNNLYLRDRVAGTTERLTRPWHGGEFTIPMTLDIRAPAVSSDGRFVAFASGSSELLQGDGGQANMPRQIYVLDRQEDSIERVSNAIDGTFADLPCSSAELSDDGRLVAFYCEANNLPGGNRAIYVVDRYTGTWVVPTQDLDEHVGAPPSLELARDGSAIAFSWRSADPASPYFDRSLIFTVELQGTAPPASPARPVPGGGGPLWLALAALVLIAAAWRYRPAR